MQLVMDFKVLTTIFSSLELRRAACSNTALPNSKANSLILDVRRISMEIEIKLSFIVGESKQKSISLLLPTRLAAIMTIFSPLVIFVMILLASCFLSQKYSGLMYPVMIKGFSIFLYVLISACKYNYLF